MDWNRFFVACVLGTLVAAPTHATNGHVLHGVGPLNQAMGGAGTAYATDVPSALVWNPATLADFSEGRLDVFSERFFPNRTLASSIDANALGPGVPATDLGGQTQSDQNAALLPGIGAIYRPKGSATAYGFAITALAGFGVEYDGEDPVSPGTNPIVSAQPPGGLGFGRISSDYQLMTLVAGASHELTPGLSIGFAGVAALSRFKLKPASFGAPDDANGDTFATYPGSNGFDEAFGGGFRLGLRYVVSEDFFVGFSYSSPIWFEEFDWSAEDELGAPRELNFGLDFPAQVNLGFSWKPFEGTRVASDLRWIDYANTNGFRRDGYAPNGAVRGFGWKSILVLAFGVEHDVTDRVSARVGYNYGENPIPGRMTFFNSPAPAIVQHHLSFGTSIAVTKRLDLHATYYHAFRNSDDGPIVMPTGPVANTRVRSELSEHSISVGLTLHIDQED